MEEEDEEEFTVQSEIFNPFSKSPDASGLVVSEFSFFNPLLEGNSSTKKKLLFDRDGDLVLKRQDVSTSVISIEHQARTTLGSVGHQVWRGALLLGDLVLDSARVRPGSVVLELGAGTGLSAIAASLHAKQVMCTDINVSGLLDQIRRNIYLNEDLIQCPITVHELDFYSEGRGSEKLRDCFSKANVIIAADVVYDDDLTDAFVSTLDHIMRIPPRKTAYIALEKRYVFTVSDLNTGAPCYEHFLSLLTSHQRPWLCQLLPLESIHKRFCYERLPQLTVWQLTATLEK